MNPPWLKIAAFLCVAGLLSSCGSDDKKPRFDAYGLRSYEIRMAPSQMGEFLSGANEHIEVPARVLVNGELLPAMVSAAGASTIHQLKKSLNVKFQKKGAVDDSTDLRLATTIGDPSMLRTLLALEIFAAAGLPVSRAQPVFVYLNDRILGLFIQIERINEEFFEGRGLSCAQIVEASERADFGPDLESRLGDALSAKLDPENLEAFIHLSHLVLLASDEEFTARVFKILDRESVVRYMAAGKVTNQWDGFNKNLYYRVGKEGRITLVPWDFDLTWTSHFHRGTDSWDLNLLYARLGKIPAVRGEVDAEVAKLLAGAASAAQIDARILAWKSVISRAYAADPFFIGGKKSLDAEAEKLRAEIQSWRTQL